MHLSTVEQGSKACCYDIHMVPANYKLLAILIINTVVNKVSEEILRSGDTL